MIQAFSLPIPCLGTSQPYYNGKRGCFDLFDTKTKVALVASAILAVIGLILSQSLPLAGGTCLIAAPLLCISALLFEFVKFFRAPDSDLEKLEMLAPAKQLAAGIKIPSELQEELKRVIPTIDEGEKDEGIAETVDNDEGTKTFTLRSHPQLQFRISTDQRRLNSPSSEMGLACHYENMIYAQEICNRENYNLLFVPPIKPIFLNVNRIRRAILVEKVIQSVQTDDASLITATEQMVKFLLKTGEANGNISLDRASFLPVAGNKLALRNLRHLTDNPHSNPKLRDWAAVGTIIGPDYSLICSLNSEMLIDKALAELSRERPCSKRFEERFTTKRGIEIRTKEIQEAKERRIKEIHPTNTALDAFQTI